MLIINLLDSITKVTSVLICGSHSSVLHGHAEAMLKTFQTRENLRALVLRRMIGDVDRAS